MRQTQMIDQIGGCLRRAVSRQIFRCRADHHPIGTEIFRYQIVVMNFANADRQIDAFIDQINPPVSQIQLNPHVRPELQKRGGERRNHAATK
ncbi:hypothetical protein D3C80_1463520 [compost metagenome]